MKEIIDIPAANERLAARGELLVGQHVADRFLITMTQLLGVERMARYLGVDEPQS